MCLSFTNFSAHLRPLSSLATWKPPYWSAWRLPHPRSSSYSSFSLRIVAINKLRLKCWCVLSSYTSCGLDTHAPCAIQQQYCPIVTRLRLRAVTYTAGNLPSDDEGKSLDSATYIAKTIPSVEYVGLQRGFGTWPWRLSGCHWFRVLAGPQRKSAPVLEKLTQREADALVIELLAMQRE